MNLPYGKLLTVFLLASLFSLSGKGQGWERSYPQFPAYASYIDEMTNQDLIFLDDSLLHCVDRFGNYQWGFNLFFDLPQPVYPLGARALPNGNAVVLTSDYNSAEELITFSPQGTVVNRDTVGVSIQYVHEFYTVPSGGYIVIERYNGSTNTIFRLAADGDSLWAQTYAPAGADRTYLDILPTLDQGFVACGFEDNGTFTKRGFITKFDDNGNVVWNNYYFNDINLISSCRSMAQAPDSTFLVSTADRLGAQPFNLNLMKISRTGDSLDLFPVVGHDIEDHRVIKTTDGQVLNYAVGNWGTLDRLIMVKRDWSGNVEWISDYQSQNNQVNIQEVVPLLDTGFAAVGWYSNTINLNQQGPFLARTTPLGQPFENLISGGSYYDMNGNCQRDSTEPSIPYLLMELTGDTSIVFNSDLNGDLNIPMPAGNYTLDVSSANFYWQRSSCINPIAISFPVSGDTAAVDIPMTPTVVCPALTVDITNTAFPICFDWSSTVSYANVGTDTAYNAYIDVTLPPNIIFDSASIPHALQTNGDFRFPIGDIPFLATGQFEIYFSVSCPSNPLDLLGFTECTEARIYPISDCFPPNPAWDSSNVEVRLDCTPTDSLHFIVKNNSNSAMTTSGNYLVLEDNIMRMNTPFTLGANDSLEFFRAGNGSTWTLTADQSPGHPTSRRPLISVEGCGTNSMGGVSQGFLAMMPQDDDDPQVSISCSEFVGAYDPNDKMAFPEGIGDLHEIEVDQEIEYLIRFQNTGTWWAQDVVLRDTLDSLLDLGTIRMISASHEYTWQLLPNRELVITFANIMLPDSFTDEPNSHGWAKYAIYPDSSLLPGQRFENRAGIYFDYNPPIITNTVFHTIALNMFGVVSIDEAEEQNQLPLQVYPNPFSQATTFRMEDPMGKEARFSLYNLNGQLVQAIQPGPVTEFTFQRAGHPAGMYFFTLEDGKGRSATGKIIIQILE